MTQVTSWESLWPAMHGLLGHVGGDRHQMVELAINWVTCVPNHHHIIQYCTAGTMCKCRDVHAYTTHDVVQVLFRELNIA